MADSLIADETRPLLADTVYKTHSATTTAVDDHTDLEADGHGLRRDDLVAFADDPDNPRNWPAAFRWTIVFLLAFMAFTVTFTCISVVPFASHIVDELEGHGKDGSASDGGGSGVGSASVLLVTIWELGEAAGPLAIAPLSETVSWGRAKVLTATSALFALATAFAAVAPSTALFIGARGLTGLAVATNVLNPAIVGDMFPPDERGSAMSLVQLTPLIGGAIGPAIGGAVADTWGWRSVLWLSTGLAVACNLLVWAAFRETYPPAVLRIRHDRLRKERQTPGALKGSKLAGAASVPSSPSSSSLSSSPAPSPSPTVSVPTSTSPSSSGLRHIRDAVLRPAILLADSFVLASLATYGAVLFSYFYVMSVSLPDILESRYGFSSAATGSSFLVFSTGAFCSVVICNRYLDPIYRRLTSTRGRLSPEDGVTRIGRPEFKLPLATCCGILLPLALAAYGWSAELVLPLPYLLFSVGFMGASMMLTFLPLAAYVVDAFGLYAASAMTGIIVSRCLCSTFLPLAVAPLIAAFGYGWGFMVLAGICLIVTPVPVFVYIYGEKWRQLSKYTRDA
ncbi:hypothetical protein HMPREF1624_06763 [Sporothrix schenckii ATCC 58251]|uniref:Major facilitator superfamily (MFS) profile domain-containing protein n=1 Tax=Sporothrix schenckii (strain ATCC 58251 / de Perez 2211183) TaxID=1391915 RepID=U7PLW3_SPOS1|nr:hypothetical protein HMPREF1624_06763 [Sporothrix schenckii ATCC 58251]